MRALIQRVASASVWLGPQIIGQIGRGLLVFFAACREDRDQSPHRLAEKLVALRVFPDQAKKMNLSVRDVGGSLLIVSQFTLYGDCQRGHRPSFTHVLAFDQGKLLYDQFVEELRSQLELKRVETGQFGAEMQVKLINDGPATFLLES